MNGIAMTGLAGAALLLLSACGSGSSNEEKAAAPTKTASWDDAAKPAEKPVQAKGEEPGTVFAASVDGKTGAVEVALPGGRLSLDLPPEKLKLNEMDIEGTKLYPGSTVESITVKAREGGTGGEDNAKVDMRFTAPAAPDVVRAWLLSNTAKQDRPLQAAGDALIGATEEGKAYRITLEPAANGKTTGLMRIDG